MNHPIPIRERDASRFRASNGLAERIGGDFLAPTAPSVAFDSRDSRRYASRQQKKTDVLNCRAWAIEHVGLLFDGPPGMAGVSFIKSSSDYESLFFRLNPKKARAIPYWAG